MKQERKFMDMESLADHQYRYDQMLKQRVYLADDLFKQRATPRRDDMDLDVMGEIKLARPSPSPYRRNVQLVANKNEQRRIISEHDRINHKLRAKEERRVKYAQYIKELNIPANLDRGELKREAMRLRAEQMIRIAMH